ncbi:MAG: hypothetical protein E7324_07575 [Clostridiales bacterium]|nr:hypothetical protein [Clostridiales bacterium]
MKKLWMLMALLTLAAALLTGCASNADTLASPTPGAPMMTPQASPNITDDITDGIDNLMPGLIPSASPNGTAAPDMGAGGIASLEDAKRLSDAMEDALEMLSEVDDAYVVATGDTALVGLEFTAQYQGQADDRIKKMVLSRVRTVDQSIKGVAVTADPAQVRSIEALADSLEDATSLSAISAQAEEMISQLTVYTE